jgi:hypothetical protein
MMFHRRTDVDASGGAAVGEVATVTTTTNPTPAPVPAHPNPVVAVTVPPATPTSYRLTLTAAGAGPPVVIRLRRCLKAMKRSWGLACVRIEAVQPTPAPAVGAEQPPVVGPTSTVAESAGSAGS